MSPFFRADKIVTPLADVPQLGNQNTGTSSISSQRMFAALQDSEEMRCFRSTGMRTTSVGAYARTSDQWARWWPGSTRMCKNAPATKKPIRNGNNAAEIR